MEDMSDGGNVVAVATDTAAELLLSSLVPLVSVFLMVIVVMLRPRYSFAMFHSAGCSSLLSTKPFKLRNLF